MKKLQDRKGSGTDADPTIVTMCGVQGCCPQAVIKTSEVTITDDHGGKITLTRAEFAELGKIAR